MEVILVKDYDEMSHKAVDIFENIVQTKESPVVNINTGGTMRGFYKELVRRENEGLDLSDVTVSVLDEYIGPKKAPFTVDRYMHEQFLDLLNKSPKNVFLINGETDNPEEEIKRYQEIIEKHPRDFQLLGLGTNGHIGANEPGTSFDSEMFLADHDDSTVESTILEYDLNPADAPNQMLTLGFKEIMDAEQILLLISGKHKAEATKAFLEGEITPEVPVTNLFNHQNVIVILDEEAASLLSDEKLEELSTK